MARRSLSPMSCNENRCVSSGFKVGSRSGMGTGVSTPLISTCGGWPTTKTRSEVPRPPASSMALRTESKGVAESGVICGDAIAECMPERARLRKLSTENTEKHGRGMKRMLFPCPSVFSVDPFPSFHFQGCGPAAPRVYLPFLRTPELREVSHLSHLWRARQREGDAGENPGRHSAVLSLRMRRCLSLARYAHAGRPGFSRVLQPRRAGAG